MVFALEIDIMHSQTARLNSVHFQMATKLGPIDIDTHFRSQTLTIVAFGLQPLWLRARDVFVRAIYPIL